MIKYIVFLLLVFGQSYLYADTSLGNHKALFKVDEIRVEGNKKVEAEAIVEKNANQTWHDAG